MFDWLAKLLRRNPPGAAQRPRAGAGAVPSAGAGGGARARPRPPAPAPAPTSESAWAATVQLHDTRDVDSFEESGFDSSDGRGNSTVGAVDGARDESERRSLAQLQARGLSALQYVAETAARICETPVAAVTMMDGQTVWLQAAVGIDLTRLAREQAFCTHVLDGLPEVLEVPDALEDARFRQLALVAGPPHIRFYAGAPFVTAGAASMGAVCVADTVPRELAPVQRRTLELLARQTVMLLDARMRNDGASHQ